VIRRWRNLLARRGRFLALPPPQPDAPGPLFRATTDRRNLPFRRGTFQSLIPTPVTPTTPWAPLFRTTKARLVAAARHGVFTRLPLVVAPAPAAARRARTGGLPSRRGVFQPVVPPQIGPGLGSLVAAFRATTDRRALPFRRGQFQALAPAPVVVAPTWVPAFSPARTQLLGASRRGRFQLFVPAPVVAAPTWAPLFRAVRPRPVSVTQRGSFAWIPPAVAPAPVFGPRRARLGGTPRRAGQFFPPPLPVTAPAPTTTRRSRGAALPSRRGHFQPVMPPQTTAGPGPLVLATIRGATRRTVPPARRGVFARFPLVGVLPGTGPLPPQLHGRPARFALPTRHGRFLSFAPAPVVATAGPLVTRLLRLRTQLVTLARHGQFQPVIPAPVAPAPQPPIARARRRTPLVGPTRRGAFVPVVRDTAGPRILVRPSRTARPVPTRRGRIFAVPFVRPAGPGPLPPALQRRARARYLPLVRGRFQQQYLLGLAPVTFTPPIHAGAPADAATRVHAGISADAAVRDHAGTPTDAATHVHGGTPADVATHVHGGESTDAATRYRGGTP